MDVKLAEQETAQVSHFPAEIDAGDAKAYLANGIKAIIIGAKRDDDLPEKAIWVKTWADVEKHLTPKKREASDQ